MLYAFIVFVSGMLIGAGATWLYYQPLLNTKYDQSPTTREQCASSKTAPLPERPRVQPASQQPAIPPATPKEKPPTAPPAIPPEKKISHDAPLVPVINVVDGDTFDVLLQGKSERVRPIGIDTPESVDPRKPVQCFGKEASQKAAELLLNKKVRLERDPSQDERDRYGRLLAYVYRDDGLFFNQWMIEQGYAHEYTYKIPYAFQQKFKDTQKTARENARGLWDPNACAP